MSDVMAHRFVPTDYRRCGTSARAEAVDGATGALGASACVRPAASASASTTSVAAAIRRTGDTPRARLAGHALTVGCRVISTPG